MLVTAAGATTQKSRSGDEVGRDPALDGVRGIAIALVLLFHCFHPLPLSAPTRALSALCGSMFIGVDLFFVLSGFLITAILIRTRDDHRYYRTFYARRALRIIPAYYAVLAVVLLLYPRFGADRWWLLTYLQNWVMALSNRSLSWNGFNHLWSLAIEEQFYLIWPIAIRLTPVRFLAHLCAGAATFSCALKIALTVRGASWMAVYTPTVTHMEGLALGGWIAVHRYVAGHQAVPRLVRVCGLAAACALVVVIFRDSSYKLFSTPQTAAHAILSSIAFAWLLYEAVISAARTPLRRLLGLGGLRFLGRYSYEIYLVHWMIANLAASRLKSRVFADFGQNQAIFAAGVVVTAASIVVSMLLHHGVALPLLRLKRRFPYESPSPMIGERGRRAR